MGLTESVPGDWCEHDANHNHSCADQRHSNPWRLEYDYDPGDDDHNADFSNNYDGVHNHFHGLEPNHDYDINDDLCI